MSFTKNRIPVDAGCEMPANVDQEIAERAAILTSQFGLDQIGDLVKKYDLEKLSTQEAASIGGLLIGEPPIGGTFRFGDDENLRINIMMSDFRNGRKNERPAGDPRYLALHGLYGELSRIWRSQDNNFYR